MTMGRRTGLTAAIRITLLYYVAVHSCSAEMEQYLFSADEVQKFGARCLDGSPSGFYYEKGSNTSNWVFYLEGGGFCDDESSCQERSRGHLGSSKGWLPTRQGSGLLSTDKSDNTAFFTWNHIYIPYCSGDLHSGTRRVPSQWNLFFAGHLTIVATLEKLKERGGLTSALNILLSGESAGGIGAFEHVDYFAEQFLHARVRASPQGGYFFPGNPSTYAEFLKNETAPPRGPELYDLYNSTVNRACSDANPANGYRCGPANVGYLMQYLQTPVYVAENQFDKQQIFKEMQCPDEQTKEVEEYVLYYGSVMRASIEKRVVASVLGDGLYFPSCLQHTENLNKPFNSKLINNTSYGDSLADWFFGKNHLPHILFQNSTVPTC